MKDVAEAEDLREWGRVWGLAAKGTKTLHACKR